MSHVASDKPRLPRRVEVAVQPYLNSQRCGETSPKFREVLLLGALEVGLRLTDDEHAREVVDELVDDLPNDLP
eukprot:9073657-Heterocapsa_arctica.AAC.1